MKKHGTGRDSAKAGTRSSYDSALGLLARREHSARELKTKLALRGHEVGDASAAIDRLKDQHYQDDDRFAASLARRRVAQGYGPRRIVAELKSHGIGDPAVRAAIAAADVDWIAVAAAQLHRHYGSDAATDFGERSRRAGFLLRRGFDPVTVRSVTRAEVEDPDEEVG